jgi:hypothetical protein
VWRVLDRIIYATMHMVNLKPPPENCPEVNPNTGCLTVWLCDYGDSCGFTTDVSIELFHKNNNKKRAALAVHNILFMNERKDYFLKKIQICVLGVISSIPDALLCDMGTPMARSSSSSSTPSMSQSSESSESQSSESQCSEYSAEQQKDMRLNSILSPQCRNGRHLRFFKIPKSISPEQSKENFLRNVPQTAFETMLADAGGTLSQGVELFVERLYKVDAVAAVAGLKSGGGACFQRFDAAETVALQRLLGLSASKRKQLAAILCKRNGGSSVIASDKEIGQIKCAAAEARHMYGVYSYSHTPKESTQEVQVDIRYRVTCPFFQLKKQLEAMRDSSDWKEIGIQLGKRGLCIAAHILGDRGGDSMKFQLSVLARDGDGQRYRSIIGTAEGPYLMQARLEVQVRLRVRQDVEGELQAKVSSERLLQAKTCEALIRRGRIQMERLEISARLTEAKDRCNDAKAYLRKVQGTPRTNWRVHNGVKKILSGYSISPTKYHGGALTGGDIEKLVNHWPRIGAELQVLYNTQGINRVTPTADLNTIVTRYFSRMDVVMSALFSIRTYLYMPRVGTEDQELFRVLASNFGEIWRKDLRLPVPPKLHLLESHCGSQLEDLGTIGLFLEETMESAHRDDNTMNRMYCSLPDWETRDRAKVRRATRENDSTVQQHLLSLPGSKRPLSEAKTAFRRPLSETQFSIPVQSRVGCGIALGTLDEPGGPNGPFFGRFFGLL